MKKNTTSRRVIKCTVGNESYCMDIAFVQSILQANALRIETTVDEIAGTVRHKGIDVPTFRLDSLLGYPVATGKRREHVLVMNTTIGKYGLVVGNLSRATELPFEKFASLPPLVVKPDMPYFEGIADFGNANVTSHDDTDAEGSTTEVSNNQSIALVLSPEGLFSERPLDNSLFESRPLDIHFTGHNQKNGRMIVFGMPHIDTFGDKTYLALSITQVLEVSQDTSYVRIPGSSHDVLGIAKWRDYYVTVIDVPHMLGFESMPPTTRQRLVIARRTDGQLIGFHTDVHMNTVQLPLQSAPLEDIPSNTHVEMLRGCFRTQDQGVLLIPAIDRMPPLNLTP